MAQTRKSVFEVHICLCLFMAYKFTCFAFVVHLDTAHIQKAANATLPLSKCIGKVTY